MLTNDRHRITKGPNSPQEVYRALQTGNKIRFEFDGKIVALGRLWGLRCNDSGRENWSVELEFGRQKFDGAMWFRRGRCDGWVQPRIYRQD